MRTADYTLIDVHVAEWTTLPQSMSKPDRVWVLLDRKGYDRLGPVHGRTAALMDEMHDWTYHQGRFKFQGGGPRGELVTLILET